VIVISTARLSDDPAATSACGRSVEEQTLHAQHWIRFGPPKAALENVYEMVHDLPADKIVVWLDGDDTLATPYALSVVAAMYEDPNTWMTYGQFMWRDGRVGFARQARLEELLHPRTSQWIFTHLKTFRAGLFHRIDVGDLRKDGAWLEPTDMPVMFPMLEMSGPDHIRFCPNILSVYNGNGGDKNHEDYVRSLPPYKPLTGRPW